MSSSESERNKYELFMNGYIRKIENRIKLNIPKPLQYLILTFYPKIIYYNGKFYQQNCGNQIKIINQHEITGYFSAKLNEPLPIQINNDNDKNISTIINEFRYQWKLQIIGNIERKNWYFIGVVSNRCKNFNTWVNPTGIRLIDAFGITLLENNVSLGKKYLSKETKYNKPPQTNQIIVVQYKVSNISHQCSLYIYVQEQDKKSLIYSINLPQNDQITNWFPVFSKPNNSTRIKLIPNEEDIQTTNNS